MIELTAKDGHKLSAYRADPTGPSKGGVVVLQEIFGVNPHIKRVVDRFAAEGYIAIAPALFDRVRSGIELGYDEASMTQGIDAVKEVGTEAAIADIQAAVDAVKDCGKVAVVGYCWGGYLSYTAANSVSGIACAVGYYGGGIAENFGGKRKVPTLLHFAEVDPLISEEQIIQIRANRPDVSAYTYPAGHGFNCDDRDSFNAAAADKAMERSLFWISQFVVGQPPIALKNAGAYAMAKVDKKKKKKESDDLGPPMD
jgi:carboxymethylenebutenolidase